MLKTKKRLKPDKKVKFITLERRAKYEDRKIIPTEPPGHRTILAPIDDSTQFTVAKYSPITGFF